MSSIFEIAKGGEFAPSLKVTLSGLASFSCVARHKNFARAAEELGVSPTAISKTIKILEHQLGVRLFNRTTRSVSLTEHGTVLYDNLVPALELLRSSVLQVSEEASRAKGVLRINTSYVAHAALIQPHMYEFTQKYPDVVVDFSIDDKLVDIVASGFDAGIRSGRSIQKDMIALSIGGVQRCVVVASPDYLKRNRIPESAQDLLNCDCIRQRFVSPTRFFEWRFNVGGALVAIDVSGRLIFNEMRSAMEAASRGLGFAYVYFRLASELIDQGRLVPLFLGEGAEMEGFYVYYPNRSHMPVKLRVFIDFMRQANK